MNWTRKSSSGTRSTFRGRHRYEHWYRDNQVYFITARVRAGFPAFASEEAKSIFWRYFETNVSRFGFFPWVTSLLDNHYHTMGYLRRGDDLPRLMHRLHGGVAKSVNDLLERDGRRIAPPFWGDRWHRSYMDGCLRDPVQAERTYRYIYRQSVRHGVASDPRDYPHTRVQADMAQAIRRAEELKAFLYGVRYRRYER